MIYIDRGTIILNHICLQLGSKFLHNQISMQNLAK